MPSREREAYVLNIVDRSLVYGEVVYKIIRPECMLCGSTTKSSPAENGVVFTWMVVLNLEKRVAYFLMVVHCSPIYIEVLCSILWLECL